MFGLLQSIYSVAYSKHPTKGSHCPYYCPHYFLSYYLVTLLWVLVPSSILGLRGTVGHRLQSPPLLGLLSGRVSVLVNWTFLLSYFLFLTIITSYFKNQLT